MTQLDNLLQEVIEFSNLIAYSENPADPDLQNACRLFSDYLAAELKTSRRNLIGTAQATRWSARELNKLEKLVASPKPNTQSSIEWIRALFQYCIGLQQNRVVAA